MFPDQDLCLFELLTKHCWLFPKLTHAKGSTVAFCSLDNDSDAVMRLDSHDLLRRSDPDKALPISQKRLGEGG